MGLPAWFPPRLKLLDQESGVPRKRRLIVERRREVDPASNDRSSAKSHKRLTPSLEPLGLTHVKERETTARFDTSKLTGQPFG